MLLTPSVSHALRFAGTPDRFAVEPHPTAEPVDAITMMIWAKFTTITGSQMLQGRFAGTSSAGPYYQRLAGQAFRTVLNLGGVQTTLNTGNIAQIGVWYHYAVVYDGLKITTYINSASTTSITATGALTASASQLLIGGDGSNGSTFDFTGDEYDARVYNRALSASEIRNYYHTGLASRQGLVHHLPLWGTPVVDIADGAQRIATSTGAALQGSFGSSGRYRR